MLYDFFYWISSIFQTYNCFLIATMFFNKSRISKKKEYLAYVILFLIISVPCKFITIPIVTIAFSLIGEVMITFIYVGSIKKKLLAGFFMYAYITVIEAIVALLSGCVQSRFFESNDRFSTFGIICLPVVEYLFIRIIRNFKNVKEGENIGLTYWIITICFPVFTVIIVCIILSQFNINLIEASISIVLLLAIDILAFYLYDHQIDVIEAKKERDILKIKTMYQNNQIVVMDKSMVIFRQQRHDYLKHISMIANMLENGQKDEAMEYTKELEEHVEHAKINYINTGNKIMDAIINYYLHDFTLLNTKLELSVKVPEEYEFSFFDLNSILSNLFSNALEALEEIEEEERELGVSIRFKKSVINIDVSNTFNGIYEEQKGRYITQKQDKWNHGNGLAIIESIVEKYNGLWDINVTDRVFSVNIRLFLMDDQGKL